MLFWILVLVIIVLSCLCLYMYDTIQSFKRKVFDLENECREILERKIYQCRDKEVISMENISNNVVEKKVDISEKIEEVVKVEKGINDKKVVINNFENIITSEKLDNKEDINVIKEKKEVVDNRNNVNEIDEVDFDLKEFIRKRDSILNDSTSRLDVNTLEEISNEMENSLIPQTVELTNYEKEQEDNAIISYKELINVKDKIVMLDDENSTNDFIDALKDFRSNLN